MIHGAHVILFSKDADADRDFLRDVLGKPKVADAGGGWLIYALPPAEIAVHPAGETTSHELYFMCDDIDAFRRAVATMGAACTDVQEQRWGRLVEVTMPSGGKLGVYEPKHASPHGKPKVLAKKKPAAPAKKKAASPKKKAPAPKKSKARAKKPAPRRGR